MKENKLAILQQQGLVVEGIYRDVGIVRVCDESGQWADLPVTPRLRIFKGQEVTVFEPKKPSSK